MCLVIHRVITFPHVTITVSMQCKCSLELQYVVSCSAMHQYKHWMTDYHYVLYVLDPTNICRGIRSKPKYSGLGDFYLSHPYNCQWYIRCHNDASNGVNMRCPPNERFNPHYSDSKNTCLEQDMLKHCIERDIPPTTTTTTTTTTSTTTTTPSSNGNSYLYNLPSYDMLFMSTKLFN